jgi:hypothetical protein
MPPRDPDYARRPKPTAHRLAQRSQGPENRSSNACRDGIPANENTRAILCSQHGCARPGGATLTPIKKVTV